MASRSAATPPAARNNSAPDDSASHPGQRLQDYAGWLALRLFRAVVRLLPDRTALRFGGLVGSIGYALGVRRNVVLANLETAFPEWNSGRHRQVAREASRNLGRLAVECMQLPRLSSDRIEAMIDGIDGEENLEAVGGTTKPFVVVTAHIGNWELMGAYFALRGYRLKVIAKPLHNLLVEEELTATRRSVGFDILYTREGMKPGLRHLREGGVLAILADQDARRQGIAVPFFGRPASTALGPAVFAWLARVPIMPVFSYRVGPLRHRFRFFPAIEVPRNVDREEALAQATAAHVRVLEAFIREHPEDYFWFHRRWKTPARKTRDFDREE